MTNYVKKDYGYADCDVCGEQFKKKKWNHKRCSSQCTTVWQRKFYWNSTRGRPVVYMLYSNEDERVYIGKTTNPEQRLRGHQGRNDKVTSRYLSGTLKMRILAECKSIRDMNLLEQVLIAFTDPELLVNNS